MVVTVKLFAVLREGRFQIAPQEYPPGTSIAAVLHDLRIPKEMIGVAMVNGRHADVDRELSPGDTLALFPLLGGG